MYVPSTQIQSTIIKLGNISNLKHDYQDKQEQLSSLHWQSKSVEIEINSNHDYQVKQEQLSSLHLCYSDSDTECRTHM